LPSEVEIKVYNATEIEAAFQKAPGVFYRKYRRAFIDISTRFQRFMRTAQMSGRPGLRVISGTLRRSLTFAVTGGSLATLKSTIFFDTTATALPGGGSYAAVQEYGAVIRARNKKYLAIPVFKGGAFAAHSKNALPLSFGKLSKASSIMGVRFVKSVKIPPRLKFFESWASQANQTFINAALESAAQSAVAEVAKI